MYIQCVISVQHVLQKLISIVHLPVEQYGNIKFVRQLNTVHELKYWILSSTRQHLSYGDRLEVCVSGVCSVVFVFGCQYECNWLPGKTRLRNDLLCVEWDVKPYALTHLRWNIIRTALCWIVWHKCSQSAAHIWAVLTGQTDWVCHTGTLTLCIEAVA